MNSVKKANLANDMKTFGLNLRDHDGFVNETVLDALVHCVQKHSGASKEIEELRSLCQIMLDPENQPPQFSVAEAWEKFKAL